ncbi:MAG: T9SS type A sorting domain-containing protein, partial [Bacteroidota bacterium]
GDSWEGDGLFMEVKNAAGQLGEFHLYFNDDSRVGTAKADSAVYEVGGGVSRKSQAFGIGLANAGTVPYDTTQTDSGYTLELQIHLDSLGFTSSVESLQVLIDIFDPDGYPAGAGAWVGPDSRSYYKTWWGSEWGPVTRTIHLAPLTGVQEEKGLPTTYSLQQNYPNPFNPATTIKYGIPLQSFVTLKLYNMLGQEVAVLVNGEQHAGYYSVNFNANALASGLYFYRLQTGAFSATKKMMLVK